MDITDSPSRVRAPVRIGYTISRYWIVIFGLALTILVGLPFLAPVFMHFGWTAPSRGIYFIYSVLCHQLPQRSFFMYGPKTMYSLNEIQAAWQDTLNPLILRQFVGNPEMGWKVAWSDRMVSMYASLLVFGLVCWSIHSKVRSLPWRGMILFLLPMVLDGGSHMISDLWGIGEGFRYTNEWLARLTNNSFPASFYLGDGLGSFNSWIRLLTGVIFGAGVAWFSFPHLHTYFSYKIQIVERRTSQADAVHQ